MGEPIYARVKPSCDKKNHLWSSWLKKPHLKRATALDCSIHPELLLIRNALNRLYPL